MMGRHIAVDLGSSNCKVYMGEITPERKITYQEISRFDTPRVTYKNHLCINIYSIYEEILKVLTMLGEQGICVRSLGVDTWATDYGIVDLAGYIKGLPVFYRDDRTRGMAEYAETVVSYEELYKLTTQRKLRESTLLQIVSLMNEDEQALAEGDTLLFLGDLLMYMLTGNAASEVSAASYSQMFSMKKMGWEDKVFDLFHIPKFIQPRIIQAGENLGTMYPSLLESCRLESLDIVAPAVHDTSSAVAAIPADRSRDFAFIATGTWFLVGMELDEPADPIKSFRYELSNTGLAFKKTMLKRNVTAMWILQECRRIWNQNGMNLSFPQILQASLEAKSFAGMIDPDADVFFHPEDMPGEIAEYLMSTQGICLVVDDVGQIARIVYESVAMKCAYALNVLERVTGKAVDDVYIIGGASAISVLNQYIANAAGKEIITGPKEASSVGNILLQAYGCNEVTGQEEISEIIRNTFPETRYIPEDIEVWSEQLKRYMEFTGCSLEEE